jgi:hypothetical protein
MQIPENVAERVRENSINSIVDKYKNITDIKCDEYKQLCAAYRRAMDDKDKELADRLYELMYSIQKKKKRTIANYSSNRYSFWKYIKRMGRHNIFSANDVSRKFKVSMEDSERMIKEAVNFRLIYKDGPTTYRMRNAKKINSYNISAYLEYKDRQKTNNEKKKHLTKVDINYQRLLEASTKSSGEIAKEIDELNNRREVLKRRRENAMIADGRKTKKINWGKDARKMQNMKRMQKYKTISGGNSFKKESIDPDEKDKTKRRNLQLGTVKRFIDFYGLDG